MGRHKQAILGFWFYQKNHQPKQATLSKKQIIKKDPWQTFEKKPNTISSHKSTKKEIKKAKLKTRKPASVMANYFPRINGRRIYGNDIKQYLKKGSPLTYKNKYNKEWKGKLGKKLLAFQPKNVKLFIRKDDALVLIERGGGRLVEKVSISFIHTNGMKTGYEAYIDSETGDVVKTWNQTRHEKDNLPRFNATL